MVMVIITITITIIITIMTLRPKPTILRFASNQSEITSDFTYKSQLDIDSRKNTNVYHSVESEIAVDDTLTMRYSDILLWWPCLK
jgi:hypothetical protein